MYHIPQCRLPLICLWNADRRRRRPARTRALSNLSGAFNFRPLLERTTGVSILRPPCVADLRDPPHLRPAYLPLPGVIALEIVEHSGSAQRSARVAYVYLCLPV